MKKNLHILPLLLALVVSSAAMAQSVVVGKVVDQNGDAVIGAAVTIKDDFRGVTTDLDGAYSIAASSDDVLIFSYVGYETQEVETLGKTTINITLSESSFNISEVEVVSIGYGTLARRDLTGSISKVDMSDATKGNVTNVDGLLTGRVSGVVVRQSDGELGKDASITIRGNNSLTQSNDPLYVVDGFPMEGSFSAILGSADVESIDILKDASATAIYGARAANGVIVITTKKGQEGAPRISFDASFTGDKLANKVDLMGPYEFVKLQSEMFTESEMSSSYFSDSRDLSYYQDLEGYDWQDEVYRNAFTQNYSVALSGGTKGGTRYNISISALDQEGILINSEFQRYQGRVNITQPITKNLEFTLNTNYTNSLTKGVSPTTSNNTSSQSGWLIYSIWGYRPISPDPDSSLLTDLTDFDVAGSNDYRFNPVLSAQNEVRNTKVNYFNANGALTYKITPALTLKTTGGYTLNNRRREEFNGSMTYTGYAGSPSGKGVNGLIYNYDKATYLNENTLSYKKRFGRSHNLDALAGLSLQGEQYKFDGVSATQLSTEALGLAGLYTGDAQIVEPVYEEWRMMSAYARFNYNYNYKYYLTATMRADGSSKFPTSNRWGYFPSIGVSWNMERENWMKSIWWISTSKLRASWGQTGNNRTTTPYDYYAQITTSPDSSSSNDYVFDSQIVPGYYVSQVSNDDLKWETTTQTNFGVDLGLFEGRVRATVDWYVKDTRDLLLNATLPTSSGYTSAMMNIGSMRNKGWEFSLQTQNVVTNNFSWSTSFNIAFNKNTVTALANGQSSLLSTVTWDTDFNSQYPYISMVGQPTGMMYGYIYEGTYKYDDFNYVDGEYILHDDVPHLSSYTQATIQPGDPKYADVNGDGTISDSDLTIIGSGQPLHTGGFGNSFTFKGFDLNVFFTWSYGNDILNANRLVFEQGQDANTNQLASYADRWSADNPDSDIPRVRANGMQLYSSRVVEDGSYLRLSNISLGYTLPSQTAKRWGMQSVRFYTSLNNIYTLTSYSGSDPEVSTRSSVLTPGFDWSAYPRTSGVTLGVNLTL
ncbi:MAG: TonB-dependent receptor [Rikenellaceae bacterium]